jgi:hypothetical protein
LGGEDFCLPALNPFHQAILPEKDWLPFLKYVKHAPNINPEEGKDYLEAADRW